MDDHSQDSPHTTLIKFEPSEDDKGLRLFSTTFADALQRPIASPGGHPDGPVFKMEPDTTLSDMMAPSSSSVTSLPSNLIALSPMPPSVFSADSPMLGSELDLLSVASSAPPNDPLSDDGNGMDDLPGMTPITLGKRKRPSRTRRRSSSPRDSPVGKSRFRRHISPEELAAQRNQANIRERMRTQSLNEAFASLRHHIPTMPSDKMSKIQTLKLASDYIGFLYNVLEKGEVEEAASSRPENGHFPPTGGDKNLSYYFNMWRMQDVWNSGGHDLTGTGPPMDG